ncbi:hypothetical protein GCM10020221_22340 [Streptomyces thioluteus]|uniref:NAD-glutamate dehydrogenase N-terminal ACT1 domain-containing protein n=1 Tax=Streptomyces thioluteus TaxID=66431 RepID=A0ABN3WUH7_STRTU
MQTKLDEAKAELLVRAARVAENSPAGGAPPTGAEGESGLAGDALAAYLQRYYLHTAPEDLTGRDPIDVFGAALSHYRLAENRPQGTANVRVHTPTVEENGWTCSHSVVEVVTDDMPFLVDSVTNELSRQNRGIHVVIHPQMIVRRDVTGRLLEVLGSNCDAHGAGKDAVLPHDALVESWIHVETDRETDRGDLKQITADLLRVLSDVREAVEDWEKMRDAALRLADGLPDEPAPADLPVTEVDEARELLRWLAADHFTFLGYREYELTKVPSADAGEEDALTAVPRHRPGHPALGPGPHQPRPPRGQPRPAGPPGVRVLQPAPGRRPRQGPRAQAARPHQGQQPCHRAPPVLPGLRGRQEVRRRRQRDR